MMNLNQLKDDDLLNQTKELAQSERQITTKILHHLKEVERRKLFCDLGYKGLFEYAVNELKYSEGQAGRRIQAMRLIKEIPQLETKISSGELSLSNISQAQSFFREQNKKKPDKPLTKSDKMKVLDKLENKSYREGQKELIKLQPKAALPKERELQITETDTEVRFIMSEKVRKNMKTIRSLLGVNGSSMSFAEVFEVMSEMTVKNLKERKFGKKRSQQHDLVNKITPTPAAPAYALVTCSYSK